MPLKYIYAIGFAFFLGKFRKLIVKNSLYVLREPFYISDYIEISHGNISLIWNTIVKHNTILFSTRGQNLLNVAQISNHTKASRHCIVVEHRNVI